ncbi:ABC transporter substrate-binding protein [uncultured Psychrobacter sp.]|jgi:iron complex transport system substrate-binding protein|uniref:heme/hemin ABC transporter substrate-binding protein n=1 Tax=uncultured Psychrobacter sp. TaxID=259303 RepID=UPI00262B1368|nr:ABC transporter substrate-binding protein [uncultured Psychrobacter sp.]
MFAQLSSSFSRSRLISSVFVGSICALTALSAQAYERIVAMSPDVADIIVALGATDKLVGKDATNSHPALKDVPKVGMHRNITAESVLAVKPDLVLGSYMVQPASVYQRLNDLNVKAANVAPKEGVDYFANSIKATGIYIGNRSEAAQLADRWFQDMQPLAKTGKRYILSYDGRIVAGKGTVGDELIRRAGGINAANVSGLKPMSREGWLAAKPDVIIIADHNQKVIGGVSKFRKRPEIAVSNAAKNNKVEFWPADKFLRYGLNSPKVIKSLHDMAK